MKKETNCTNELDLFKAPHAYRLRATCTLTPPPPADCQTFILTTRRVIIPKRLIVFYSLFHRYLIQNATGTVLHTKISSKALLTTRSHKLFPDGMRWEHFAVSSCPYLELQGTLSCSPKFR